MLWKIGLIISAVLWIAGCTTATVSDFAGPPNAVAPALRACQQAVQGKIYAVNYYENLGAQHGSIVHCMKVKGFPPVGTIDQTNEKISTMLSRSAGG